MRIRLQIHRLSVLQIAVILLSIGLFFGVLCANLFYESYEARILNYEETVFPEITSGEIDYSGFFFYVLGKNFNEFIIFWLLCITILGIPYMAFKITSFGFFAGFLISAVTMQYGIKGIVLVLAYIFPHGIVYLPIILICLYKGFELCKTIYRSNHASFGGVIRPLKSYIIIILLLAAALLIGSFLEAYPGAFLLKKALGIFK